MKGQRLRVEKVMLMMVEAQSAAMAMPIMRAVMTLANYAKDSVSEHCEGAMRIKDGRDGMRG